MLSKKIYDFSNKRTKKKKNKAKQTNKTFENQQMKQSPNSITECITELGEM